MLISHGFNLGCPCRLSDGVDAPWSSLSTLALEMVTGGNRDLFLRLVPSRVGIFGEILNDAQNVILRRFCVAGLSPLDWRSLAGNVGKSFKTPDSSSASFCSDKRRLFWFCFLTG